ncbi:MAG: short-chain dehydrogenase, partial [Planctomycetaceae bacterium]|nr:short-chain dehydrogenase [Planctomycetaceae bacterium]
MLDTYADRWALITGASSGIGAEFASKLAARGMHLVLAARRTDKMQELATELDTRHGTKTLIISSDLSQPGAGTKLYQEISAENIDIELLINNAGFAQVGTIEDANVSAILDLVQVN